MVKLGNLLPPRLEQGAAVCLHQFRYFAVGNFPGPLFRRQLGDDGAGRPDAGRESGSHAQPIPHHPFHGPSFHPGTPISGLGQKLAAIWGNLLGLDASHSSIYDNFFLLPGRLMMSIIKGRTDICGSSMKKGPSLLGLLNSKRCVWEFRDQDVDLHGNNTKAS